MTTTPPTASDTARLFLALWPDEALRPALVAWRDDWQWPASAVLVRAEDLHLTLHFLGNVPVNRLPELIQEAGPPCEPFELNLGHGELWPHGIAVLRPAEADVVPPSLAKLHNALQRTLTRLALPTESRAFRPHITLARHAQAAAPPTHGPALRWQVHSYVLVQSWPGKSGGYSVVRRYD